MCESFTSIPGYSMSNGIRFFALPWEFVASSWKKDPAVSSEADIREGLESEGVKDLKYSHPGIHKGMFALPVYLLDGLPNGRRLTDDQSFIWKGIL